MRLQEGKNSSAGACNPRDASIGVPEANLHPTYGFAPQRQLKSHAIHVQIEHGMLRASRMV